MILLAVMFLMDISLIVSTFFRVCRYVNNNTDIKVAKSKSRREKQDKMIKTINVRMYIRIILFSLEAF